MKKLLLYTGTCLVAAISNADAANNCCANCPFEYGASAIYDANCTSSTFCNNCSGTITVSIINGVCTPTCNSGGDDGPIINPDNPDLPIIGVCEKNQYKGFRNQCSDCPNGGTTGIRGGGDSITDCYLPKGTTGTDATGTYTFTDDCHYTGISL